LANSLGSIFVDLLLNTAKFEGGVKSAKSQIAKFGKDLEDFAKTSAVAVGAAAGALALLAIRQANVIDETGKMARSIGVNVGNFQALGLVADEAGVAQDQLAKLFDKSQKAIVEAAKGSKSFNEIFKQIGVNAQELINLTPDEQFIKIAESLAEIENPTIRNAAAMEIFGKNGRQVTEMLSSLRDRLQEAREFNDKFNITISDIDSRKVEEANDAFGRIGRAIGGLGNTIAIEVAPLVTELSNRLLNAGVDGEDFGKAVDAGMTFAANGIDGVRIALIGLEAYTQEAILGVNELILKSADGILNYVQGIQASFPRLGKVLDPIATSLDGVANSAAENYSQAQDALNQLNRDASNFESTASRIKKIQDEATDRAKAAGTGAGGVIPESDLENLDAQKKSQDELGRLYEKNRDLILGLSSAQIGYIDTEKELTRLFESRRISVDEYFTALDNLDTQYDESAAKANKWGFDLEAAGKKAAENLQDAFADFLFDPFAEGAKGMLKGFVDVLRRMAAEAIATKLGSLLLGDGSKGSTGILSGIFDKIGGAIGGSNITLGSVALPKFATGIDYVPQDMPAIIHKEEAVLNKNDAQAWRKGGASSGNTYIINAQGQDGSAIARVEQALITLAGPGVIEQRVNNARARGIA